jgi:hypothetical protein
MTSNQDMTISDQESANGFTVDARSMKIGGVLLGVGGLICLAGLAVSGYALYDAISRWIGELEQPPSAMVQNTWAQAKAATTAGLRAWLDQQDQQAQQQQAQQQLPAQRAPQAV